MPKAPPLVSKSLILSSLTVNVIYRANVNFFNKYKYLIYFLLALTTDWTVLMIQISLHNVIYSLY